jgi:hypothetical protein
MMNPKVTEAGSSFNPKKMKDIQKPLEKHYAEVAYSYIVQ